MWLANIFLVLFLTTTCLLSHVNSLQCYVCQSSDQSLACNDGSSLASAINCVGRNYTLNQAQCKYYTGSMGSTVPPYPAIFECTSTYMNNGSGVYTGLNIAKCMYNNMNGIISRGCGNSLTCPAADVQITSGNNNYTSSCCSTTVCNTMGATAIPSNATSSAAFGTYPTQSAVATSLLAALIVTASLIFS